MASKQEHFAVSPGMIRRLMRDNSAMGRALAGHEFRRMSVELNDPAIFGLEIDFPGETPAEPLAVPSIVGDPVARRLPVLNVPLGSVVWVDRPSELPVLGIYVPEAEDPAELRSAFRALMTAHASEPFARFVFFCAGLETVPFLGRYGFAYEVLGPMPLETAAERARLRYGLGEIRTLIGTRRLWPA